MTRCLCLLAALAAATASAQQVDLRLGGRELPLSGEAQAEGVPEPLVIIGRAFMQHAVGEGLGELEMRLVIEQR